MSSEPYALGGRVRSSVRRRLAGVDVFRLAVVVATAALLLYLIVVPLFFLIFGSVFTGRPGQSGELTLETYRNILTDPRSYELLATTFVYALGSTCISFVIGVTIAWVLQRTDLPAKRAFALVAMLPVFMPSVLSTIGWIFLLDANIGVFNTLLRGVFGLESGPFDVYSLAGMIWIRGVLDVPLVVLWLWPAFGAMDPALEEAASVSGSTPRKIIRTITLPIVRPALFAAFLISFVLSLEDVNVATLIGLPAGVNVFSSEIYIAVARTPADLHTASAYSVILLAIALALTFWYRRVTLHTERYVTVRGRGYRPSLIQLGRFRRPLAILLAWFLFVIVILPILLLLWISLVPYPQAPSFEALGTLTLEAYETLTQDPRLVRGLVNSATFGVVTAIIVTFLALIVGWVVVRTRSRAAGGLDLLAFTPMAIPGIVIGVSLIWLYLSLPLPIEVYGTAIVLIIAYVTRFIPYGVRLSYAGFAQLHPELEEAAATSGSSWFHVIRTVSIPLLTPTLIAAAIYIFLRTFSELPASLLLYSFGNEPYSVVVFHLWAGGQTEKTAAYGIVAIVFMAAIVIVLQRFGAGRILRS